MLAAVTKRAPSTLLAVLVWTSPGASGAEQAGREGPIAVLALAGAQAGRTSAEEVAAALVRGIRPEAVLSPEQVRELLVADGGGPARQRALRLAAEARRELEAFVDLERAARLLQEAAEAQVDLLPVLEGVNEPVRLYVELAMVALAMGDEDRVGAALREAVRLDPDLDLDPAELPGRLVRAARLAREAGADAPILSTRWARPAARSLGAAFLVVVQPRPGPRLVAVELYDGASGERLERWAVEDRAVSEAASGLLALVGPRRPDGPEREPSGRAGGPRGREPEQPSPAPRPRTWHREWWLWTLVGVVVAGAAAGLAVAAVEGPQPSDVDLRVERRW